MTFSFLPETKVYLALCCLSWYHLLDTRLQITMSKIFDGKSRNNSGYFFVLLMVYPCRMELANEAESIIEILWIQIGLYLMYISPAYCQYCLWIKPYHFKKERKMWHELKSWTKLLIESNNNNSCVQDLVLAHLMSSFYPQFIIKSKSEH